MIELLINSFLFKNYRKKLIEKLYFNISKEHYLYCCRIPISKFICWKDLKEVKENMYSEFLIYNIRKHIEYQHCGTVWFNNREGRLSFLNECLDKFK